MDKAILAQYTIRSKQSYIFRTNRLVEITGASAIIRDTFARLFDRARECETEEGQKVIAMRVGESTQIGKSGGNSDSTGSSERFSLDTVREKFRTDGENRPDRAELDMVELFEGGGNDTVLFRNADVFRKVNARYTKWILETYPGLLPLCVGIPVDLSENNYQADFSRLMRALEEEKNRMLPGRGGTALPFAMMDRNTFLPLGKITSIGGETKELSDESWRKYLAGDREGKADPSVKILDDMTRDENSLLAIVHADGNNMGIKIEKKIKIQKKLGSHTDYDFRVNTMRQLTRDIDSAFQNGKALLMKRRGELLEKDRSAFEKRQEGKSRPEPYPSKREDSFAVRWLVSSGDDATFICNARDALELTKAYLQGVSDYRSPEDPEERYSSCAGICVFHSHYPFARAYDLAEDACDNAKKPVHDSVSRTEDTVFALEQGWVDFHYIHSGAGGDLKEIRALHQTEKRMLRPWMVCGQMSERGESAKLETMDNLAHILRRYRVSRGNIKTFGAVYEADPEQGKLEWDRICYHTAGLREDVRALFPDAPDDLVPDNLLRTLYDVADIYDLWYREEAEST